MTGKLDQSLDSILAAHRKTKPRGSLRHRRAGNKAKASAPPVGGVSKTKPVKKNDKSSAGPSTAKGQSKVMVSKLPHDVTEAQIKEYFEKSIGQVKKVMLIYGPNGQSRGIANIIFAQADSASKAFRELDGVKVDSKPMQVEVIVDGKDAPAPPEPKKFADRVGQPKSAAAKPKPATGPKATKAKVAAAGGRGGRRGGRRGAGRPKKTVEQLDAEMSNYFGVNDEPVAEGTAAQPASGDMNMDDEVL